jgi:hypothetical protein
VGSDSNYRLICDIGHGSLSDPTTVFLSRFVETGSGETSRLSANREVRVFGTLGEIERLSMNPITDLEFGSETRNELGWSRRRSRQFELPVQRSVSVVDPRGITSGVTADLLHRTRKTVASAGSVDTRSSNGLDRPSRKKIGVLPSPEERTGLITNRRRQPERTSKTLDFTETVREVLLSL